MSAAGAAPPVTLIHLRGGACGWREALRDGRMPRLARLASNGAVVGLAPSSLVGAAASVTLATGCLPDAHGVLLDQELRPDELGLRPASRDARRRSMIWEIAQRRGLPAAAVGWPATHPAGEADVGAVGAVVTDSFAEHNSRRPEVWPLVDGCAAPESLLDDLADLRVSALDITSEQLGAIAPRAAVIDQGRDDAAVRVAVALARCASDHAAGTLLADRDAAGGAAWDLLCIHFSLIDEISRVRREWRESARSSREAEALDDAAGNALAFLDLVIGRYMHLRGPQATYLISADPPSGEAGEGFLIAHGPGVRPAHGVEAAMIDVAPTALALLGIEPAMDVDGRAIEALLSSPVPPAVWTHERLTGPRVYEAAERARHEAMADQLRALGYAPPARRASNALAQHHGARSDAIRAASKARSAWRRSQPDHRDQSGRT